MMYELIILIIYLSIVFNLNSSRVVWFLKNFNGIYKILGTNLKVDHAQFLIKLAVFDFFSFFYSTLDHIQTSSQFLLNELT